MARFQQQQLEKSLSEPNQPIDMTRSNASTITPISDEGAENAEENDRTFMEDISTDNLETETVNDIVNTETGDGVSISEPPKDLAPGNLLKITNYRNGIQAQRDNKPLQMGWNLLCRSSSLLPIFGRYTQVVNIKRSLFACLRYCRAIWD